LSAAIRPQRFVRFFRRDSIVNADADFLPTASLATMKARHELLKRLRSFFDDRDFLEVTTPILSADTVVDEHLDPFQVTCYTDPTDWHSGPIRYLQTSPEFHMKRILCAGATAIYQITHAFRAAEAGALHNPEFTMAEWYRVGDDMHDGIRLLCNLMQAVSDCGTIAQASYAEVFTQAIGLDPHRASTAELQEMTRTQTNEDTASLTTDDCLHWLWSSQVTPQLGASEPVIVYEFPASQAALAEIRDDQPPVAERFELYWRGVELANGYCELRSAAELRRRILKITEKRHKSEKMPLPGDSRLLTAMQRGLPGCSGVALGVDRLLMLLCGEESIKRVLTFAFPRA
jgi:lysyl-tRNA synthetase class 2